METALVWKRMTFFIPGIPRGQSRPQSSVVTRKDGEIVRRSNGRAVIVHRKSDTQAADEKRIVAAVMQQGPKSPLKGPIRLSVVANMPIPSSKPKKWQISAQEGIELPTGKPDFDNIAKNLCDCFSGVVWLDDRQVVRGMVEKRYSERPGYLVSIEYLDEHQTTKGEDDARLTAPSHP